MLGRLVSTIARRTAQRGVRSYHEERLYKLPTFNDLPVPQGSWKEAYDRNQQKYTAVLITGFLFLSGTITLGRVNGWLYLNMYPPKPE